MPSSPVRDTLVDTLTLARHLNDPAWAVIDCRFSLADAEAGAREYARSRIPGARHVDLERDLSAPVQRGVTGRHPLPDREALAARLVALGIEREQQIVAYDAAAGPMAARLWWLLRWLGHESVAVLDGGFAAWREAGLRLETTPPPAPVSTGDFRVGHPLVESVDIERVAAGGLRLLDARERARFAGEHEPIDPVAGRIPGALNHPFTDNVDADGRFLPSSVLRERFAASLGVVEDGAADAGTDDAPLVHYCGSGVTAAHNVLAMTHAGLEAGALYAGSYSEWITRHAAERDAEPPIRNA